DDYHIASLFHAAAQLFQIAHLQVSKRFGDGLLRGLDEQLSLPAREMLLNELAHLGIIIPGDATEAFAIADLDAMQFPRARALEQFWRGFNGSLQTGPRRARRRRRTPDASEEPQAQPGQFRVHFGDNIRELLLLPRKFGGERINLSKRRRTGVDIS